LSFFESYSKYRFDINVSGGGVGDETSLTIARVMDDTVAFALREALLALPWAAGTVVDVQVSKQDYSDTLYTTNLKSVPPSFT